MISSELQKLGNEVHMFTVHATPNNKPETWHQCKLHNFEERHTVIDDSFDAVLSINEPDALRGVNSKPVRVCWQFLNDFTYCHPGFDDFVDRWLAVCERHKQHVMQFAPKPEKWGVLPLGVDSSWYQKGPKVPGRMVFCSSADRGLHWALQVFPEIKKAVPEASLRVFYHFQEGPILHIEPNSTKDHPHVVEMSNRLRYCKNAIQKMKRLGVEHVGSVSVNTLRQEMSEASLLLFPVDTVAFTEGFSLSIMQSHASGAIPAISSADCLGSIYKDSGCIMVEAPIRDKLKEYTEQVIKALTDKKFAAETRQKCFDFSKNYLWSDIAAKMQKLMSDHRKS
jgi:glycosyltransferase involved in cell wall biosynthesis